VRGCGVVAPRQQAGSVVESLLIGIQGACLAGGLVLNRDGGARNRGAGSIGYPASDTAPGHLGQRQGGNAEQDNN
jgi:hypothetical protein